MPAPVKTTPLDRAMKWAGVAALESANEND